MTTQVSKTDPGKSSVNRSCTAHRAFPRELGLIQLQLSPQAETEAEWSKWVGSGSKSRVLFPTISGSGSLDLSFRTYEMGTMIALCLVQPTANEAIVVRPEYVKAVGS